MLNGFLAIFNAFFVWLKIPLILLFVLTLLFIFLIVFNVLFGLIKGKRFIKAEFHVKPQGVSIIKRLFIDLPRQISDDVFQKDPDEFQPHGLIIFEGRQGRGKTMSMVEYATRLLKEYPGAKCLSNLNFTKQDFELDHWKKLVDFTNGKFGVIAMIDETQNWFSSKQSRDFPPEMLQVITQNRKNRRLVLGTAQNFYLLSKPIRSQATEVRRCATVLGCLTLVRRFIPILDSEGNVKEWKRRGFYFFIHNKELRESYDTYHVIESLTNSGFKEQINLKIGG